MYNSKDVYNNSSESYEQKTCLKDYFLRFRLYNPRLNILNVITFLEESLFSRGPFITGEREDPLPTPSTSALAAASPFKAFLNSCNQNFIQVINKEF